MGAYSEGLGRYLNREDLTLKAAAAETASTTQSANELGDKTGMYLLANVTAFSGTTPLMLITIEGSDDGLTWFTLGRIGKNGYDIGAHVGTAPTNFDGILAVRAIIPAARYVRSKSTISGTTPSFTYSVAGNAA